jgi:carboxyl-terminal processing protease
MQQVLHTYKGFFERWVLLIFFILLIQSSCKKDNNKADFPTGTDENINRWILDSLKRYYYWNEALPSIIPFLFYN